MGSKTCTSTPQHVVLFPFMSKGHTIPLIHLARLLLLRRNIAVTIFTTPSNLPFISNSLSDTTASFIEIPFPENIPDIPAGVESTDKLPSMSLLGPFANATKLMQPQFEKLLETILPVSFIVSDGFLGWTLHSASKFGIPRLVTYGTNKYSIVLSREVHMKMNQQLLSKIDSDDEAFTVPSFPWIKLTINDLDSRGRELDPKSADLEFLTDLSTTTSNSYGILVNSFYELETAFVDYWNREFSPKAFCVGPLCFVEPSKKLEQEPAHNHKKLSTWIQWLDQKLSENKSVLYVAFGSQAAEMSAEQFKEIEIGLEESNVNFLWVVRDDQKGCKLEDGFEERVKERGIVVREWVDQRGILAHESVQGFLSHCGWNSCLESMCECVPILAWPLMNDQHLNARMVVEEIKIGLRVETCNGSVRGFVKWEGLEKMVRELMEGEKGKEARKKVKEVGKTARKAMEEGGSSWKTLDQLIDELCKKS